MNLIKTFIVITTILLSVTSYGQQIYDADIKYVGFGSYKCKGGERIPKEDLKDYLTPYEYASYLDNQKRLNTGLVITGICTAATITAISLNTTDDVWDNPRGGEIVLAALAFDVCLPIAVCKLIVGHFGLVDVAKDHNKANHKDLSLQFGGTSNGIGLTMNF